jgi:capsular exopolysaccharide synthesis family protein
MAGALLGSLDVNPVHNTSLVEISYISGSPRLAQKVAEAVGSTYMNMNTEEKFESVREASDFLDRQITTLRADIENIRRQLQQYGESKGIITTGGDQNTNADNITVQKLLRLNTDYTSAQNERISKQSTYDAIVHADPSAVTANDPVVLQLAQEESQLQRDYAQKLGTFKPDYPDMQKLQEKIDKTHQARLSAIQTAYAGRRETARRDLEAAQQAESQIAGALDEQKRETMTLNVNAVTLLDLSRTLQSKQALLDQLEKKQNETEVTARLHGSNTSNIHWVDHAQLPTGRFNVTMKKNMQNALPLGIVLGLAAIFFLEYMDRSIKTPEELERITKFASLGVIPAAGSVSGRSYYSHGYGRTTPQLRAVESPVEPQNGIDLLPHVDTRSPISEAYRAFRTSLLLASASSPKVIVISSTFAREGKTTTSVNLATVLAQMGKPVLLVDADLRRPRLQKIFRGRMNLGLVNYLAANVPIGDVIQDSGVPNLDVVLSGPTPPNPSELLASDRMKHLIHEVRARYAYVIFDSPPVMAVTDSIVLAANADGVVLCVHGGHTPRDLVQRAAERLRQSNIPVLGAILNNLDLHQYGYTYKKSYYDYYDEEQRETKRELKGA